jgi:hypothetical protein
MAIDVEDSELTTADSVYKWTIRGLYTAAIALNLWFLLESYRDTPEVKTLLSRAHRLERKLLKPWRDKRRWVYDKTKMHLEAWRTVEGGETE